MNHRGSMAIVVVVMGLVGFWGGCANREDALRTQLGQVRHGETTRVFKQGIDAIGGLSHWSAIERIDAASLAQLGHADGRRQLQEQWHVLSRSGEPSLTVVGEQTKGRVTMSLSRDGRAQACIASDEKTAPIMIDTAEIVKLRLLYHAVTGLVGLLDEQMDAEYAGLQRRGGQRTERVVVNGRLFGLAEDDPRVGQEQLVVWLDVETHLPQRFWLKYVDPTAADGFGYQTALVDDYRSVAPGVTIPYRVQFVGSDSYQQLFAERTDSQVEYQDVMVLSK